jgi:hypothetical protein
MRSENFSTAETNFGPVSSFSLMLNASFKAFSASHFPASYFSASHDSASVVQLAQMQFLGYYW